MDMHLISDTFSYTHDPNRSGRAPMKAVGVALIASLAVLLALPQLARAAGEVTPLREPLGGALVTPLTMPTVLSIEPSSGTTAGDTDVTINGTEFVAGASVTIGGVAAKKVHVLGPTELSAVTPAGTPGAQEVVVTDTNGASVSGAKYTYIAPPAITSVSPRLGPTAGGTPVTISGSGFGTTTATNTVTIGTAAATVTAASATSLTVTTPAGSAGAAAVVVTNTSDELSVSDADAYTYIAPPAITSVSPSSGPTAGGTPVTISGSGFGTTIATNTVTIGGTAATVTAASATSLTITTPAGSAGAAAVVVTNTSDELSVSDAGAYTYIAPPAITSLSPSSGPTAGGTPVTISGSGFGTTIATNTVTIGGKAATVTAASATSLTVTTPHGSVGAAAVLVTNTSDELSVSDADAYTYVAAPAVTVMSPTAGPAAGGTTVTITGANLTGAAVKFGSNPATGVKVNSETSLEAVSPAGAGKVPVTVTTAGGTSPTNALDEFTYAPTVTSIAPASGPEAGGTPVTINGSGFAADSTVTIGGAAASEVKVLSEQEITATTPAGTTGEQQVVVTDAAGPSVAGPGFLYLTTPAVSSAAPPTTSSGTGGGTSTGSTGPTVVTSGLPAPVLARSANIATVAGRVTVRLPGARAFVSLSSARQVPFGTVVEAARGEISVTAARPGGGTQRGEFFDGEFVLTQGGNGQVLATLAGGDFTVCRPQAGTARAKAKPRSKFAAASHLVRRLWAEAKGNFATRARYAGTVVQGAQWLTEDMCEGSLVLATREHLEATDLVRHRRVLVPTGGVYLVKPR